jgi:hypothetical protein
MMPMNRPAAIAFGFALLCASGLAQEATPAAEPDIWTAAGQGDLEALAKLHAEGANLNALDPELGLTPLVATTGTGQTAAALWLLDNGADPNARSGDGGTALQAAAFVGADEIASALLERGADPLARNDQGQNVWQILTMNWEATAYIAAMIDLPLVRETVEAGRARILELLAPHAAEAAKGDIWFATVAGDLAAVKGHIEGGLDVNGRSPDGATLLTVAVLYRHGDITLALLDAGADVNGRNYANGSTALHAAAFLGYDEIVAELLGRNAKADALSDEGGTPLQAAQTDWQTTQYLAQILQIPLDQATTMPGKARAAELLEAAVAAESP